jgi:hypothetical protein
MIFFLGWSFGRVYKGILSDYTEAAGMSSIKVTEAMKDKFIKQIDSRRTWTCSTVGNIGNLKIPLGLRLDIAIGILEHLHSPPPSPPPL